MAVSKQRLLRKNTAGTYDTIHLETSSEVVKRPNGNALETDLAGFAKSSDLSKYALASELSKYALKTDLNSYATKTELENSLPKSLDDKYAAKNHTHTGYAASNHTHSQYLTSHQSLYGYATQSWVLQQLGGSSSGSGPSTSVPSVNSNAQLYAFVGMGTSGTMSDAQTNIGAYVLNASGSVWKTSGQGTTYTATPGQNYITADTGYSTSKTTPVFFATRPKN